MSDDCVSDDCVVGDVGVMGIVVDMVVIVAGCSAGVSFVGGVSFFVNMTYE